VRSLPDCGHAYSSTREDTAGHANTRQNCPVCTGNNLNIGLLAFVSLEVENRSVCLLSDKVSGYVWFLPAHHDLETC
jgi:hypothetical protein